MGFRSYISFAYSSDRKTLAPFRFLVRTVSAFGASFEGCDGLRSVLGLQPIREKPRQRANSHIIEPCNRNDRFHDSDDGARSGVDRYRVLRDDADGRHCDSRRAGGCRWIRPRQSPPQDRPQGWPSRRLVLSLLVGKGLG